MKADIIEHAGGPEVLTLADVPAPQAEADEVAIRVHAFGLDRARRAVGASSRLDS